MRVMVLHDVDDVPHWLASPKRDEFFHAHGMKVSTFTGSDGGNRVGVIIDGVPDLDTFHAALQTPEGAAAMKHDGVHPDSIFILVES